MPAVVPIRSTRAARGRLVKPVLLGGGLFLALYAAGLLVPDDSYLRFQSNVLYHIPALAALGLSVIRVRRHGGASA